MKNRSLLMLIVAAMFFATTMVSAQSDASNSVSLGLKFGANLSNVYDTQGEEFEADAKLGMATGLFITLPITHFLGVQPEILFSQKGYRGSGSVLGSDYSFKRTTNYIDVPLLLTFRTGDYLTLLFGPQYSFLLSQNYTFKSDVLDISRDEQFDNENLRKNTFCVTGGVDINLSNIVIGARAGWDVQSNEGDGTSSTPRYKNMWYQATIGYRF